MVAAAAVQVEVVEAAHHWVRMAMRVKRPKHGPPVSSARSAKFSAAKAEESSKRGSATGLRNGRIRPLAADLRNCNAACPFLSSFAWGSGPAAG